MMKQLERALYYEIQYRNAIVSDSLSFYDINLTKDLIENDFFVKDDKGKPVSCLERVDLHAPASFTGFFNKWLSLQVPDNLKPVYSEFSDIRKILLDSFARGKREFTLEYWSYDIFSRKIFVNQKFFLTQNENGEICALSVIKDFTNRKKNEQESYNKELEQQTYTDPITGGYNYKKFKEVIVSKGLSGTIICLDIHSFKVINTICGIETGDMVIKTIWECIMCVLKTKLNEITAHINADHFIIFLPTEDQQRIISKIKDITMALHLLSVELDIPQVLPYFGVTKWKPGKRIELAYSEAVTAKHNAKDKQEENWAFFKEEDASKLIEEKQLADAFAGALQNKEFKVWYQPKYNPVTNRLVGAEALVRWQKADGTLLPPSKFIPIFERNGMIRILDEYIFKHVCRQQKKWREQGKQIVPVSINLSRVSLYYESIASQYKHITEEIGIEKKFIPIEITETAAINNSVLQRVTDQLHRNNFHLHMDDFGSGYSSLATLNKNYFENLKLDKSLIDNIGSFNGERLLEHTISLAKELEMKVTAEGVETLSQVKFLKHNGCDSIQGYIYSKPLPVEQFEQRLEKAAERIPEEKIDLVSAHVSEFRRRYLKVPLYALLANLSKNEFVEISQNGNWNRFQEKFDFSYSEGIKKMVKTFVMKQDAEKYSNFMDREKLIEEFLSTGDSEATKILYFKGVQNKRKTDMRVLINIFKVKDSDSVWAFFTILEL